MKNQEKKKRTGKVLRTVLIVCAVVLVLGAGFALWASKSDSTSAKKVRSAFSQIEPMLNHIEAAFLYFTTTSEEQQQKIDKAKEDQVNVLKDSGFNASKEASDALVAGEITKEEYTDILLGNITFEELMKSKAESNSTVESDDVVNTENQTPETDNENVNGDEVKEEQKSSENTEKTDEKTSDGKNDVSSPAREENNKTGAQGNAGQQSKPDANAQANNSGNGASASVNDVDKQIAELVTKMYVLKSEYTGAVEGIVASMKAEYSKLPPEQRTKSSKQSIAASYMSRINSMEAQCDVQVETIVSELRKILKENGRDTSLADAIVSTYATEKANTKAYYLSTYGD